MLAGRQNMGYEELSSSVGIVHPARKASIVSCRKRNAERPRWAHVASTVQMRAHQERPTWPRVPWVILRSIATKRNRCSMALFVGATPGVLSKRK